jgi:acylphosphatase
MADAQIQRRLFISGQVQGVGYRASTVREALRYPGLRGFVRNLPDGRVEAVFAGTSQAVLRMMDWCKKGPSAAKVLTVEVLEEEVDPELGNFEVRRFN